MTTDGYVLAGGLVLADMATGLAVPWAAVAMVVVGLIATILGLAILTGRGRPASGTSPAEPDARPRPPAPPVNQRATAQESFEAAPSGVTPSVDVELPRTAPAHASTVQPEVEPVVVNALDSEEVASGPPIAPMSDRPSGESGHDTDTGGCDWELRVEVADGVAPIVVREATGRACCIHVLHLRSLDAAPAPSEREDRSWSGDRTRIGPSRAVSDVRADSRRVEPEVRGLDLALHAALSRTLRSPVVTTAEDVGGPRAIPPGAEGLWTAHLSRLREENVLSEPDEVATRLQTAMMHRTRVGLTTTRQCAADAHRLDASADVSITVEGSTRPVGGTLLSLPNVAGWIEGDLAVAATERVDVSGDTEVRPAPGIGAVPGLALDTTPGSGELLGTFTGHGDTHVVDGGITLHVACAVVADLGLGEGPGHHSAEGRVSVTVAHRIRLLVSSRTGEAAGDDAGPMQLGCACAPVYEVQFGGPPEAGGQAAPHATLHVDGRVFRLDAEARPGSGDVPQWTVRAETGADDQALRGTTR